jgi:hypothetical protein
MSCGIWKHGTVPSTLGTPKIPLRLGGRKGYRDSRCERIGLDRYARRRYRSIDWRW